MLIITGKNTITATTLILATGLVIPNHWLVIGARTMIGAEPAATPKGSIPKRMVVHRATANAAIVPRSSPAERAPQRLAQGEEAGRPDNRPLNRAESG